MRSCFRADLWANHYLNAGRNMIGTANGSRSVPEEMALPESSQLSTSQELCAEEAPSLSSLLHLLLKVHCDSYVEKKSSTLYHDGEINKFS